MTDLLPLFWPLVDADEPVFPGRIVASWREGAHEQLVELGILQPAGNAEYVLCPECFEHEEEIVALEGPGERVRFMIPCPEALRVEVPPALLQQWAINLSTLTARLAAALHLPDKPKELVPQRLWRLGRVNLAGNLCDLLFVRRIGANDTDFQSTFSTALRPMVLFAGDIPSPQWWEGRRLPSASIPLIATCTADGIVMEQAVLLGLVRQSEETNPTEALAFRRRGEFWLLNFGGETAYLKDSVGLAYIARLLSEPHRDIPAVSLLAARAGIDPRISTGSTGDVLDNAARTNYSARYQELCEDMDDATRNHDEGRIVKLQEEMEKLSTELACATGLGGRGRKKSDAERVRIAVSMAVRRAIEAISEHHAPLGRHLLVSISSGQVFRYSPDTRQEWVL